MLDCFDDFNRKPRICYKFGFYVSTVRKNMDYTMLPLECLYLNKSALINVVGPPVSK